MSDYERAAERIWKFFESHAFTMNQADLAAILREEFPSMPSVQCPWCGGRINTPLQIEPAPDEVALRDIAKRTFRMLDEGATLREKQELYNLCRSLLRSEPKGGSHTCRECAESGSGRCIEGSVCPDFVLRSEPKEESHE